MPIYEYECAKCHEVCEALQKFSDPPLSKCPHCGGKVHKMMSLGAFQLKGSGWYVTDYAGKNSSTQKQADSGGHEAPAEGKEKVKTEAKPEKKAAKTDSAVS
ncbi:MAG: zinc ribbon domain-containing protein [Desulfarculus sp.]|nr:zinc ribbon domain-containing protein [Desulfarculus sp.]